MIKKSENPKFTASDVRKVGGVSYRQLNGWDSKGALPSQRVRSSGWRTFDPRQLFVILVCAELRMKFGVPIKRLAWLQKFMLQDGANHYSAALEMMRRGLAVVIFSDLNEQFEMNLDSVIGNSIRLGYCRYDEPQSYVLLLVNPIINKMLAAQMEAPRLEISYKSYYELRDAEATTRVRDTAELAVLEAMRHPNTSQLTVVPMSDKEVLLEINVKGQKQESVQKDRPPAIYSCIEETAVSSRKVVRRVAREEVRITPVAVSN